MTPPALPDEIGFTKKAWGHGDWLSCVTNDINVYALYENDGSKTWAAGTSFGSKSIAEREEPYSLDEYFRMYDSVAWADEFSRGSNTSVAVNGSYWNYDLDDRRKISLETSGGNQAESNGCLVLTIQREHAVRQGYGQNIDYDFTGGGIKSNNKVAFKHGRYEVRAKLTHDRSCGSSFWMLGNSGGYPACGELDIFEQPSGGDWITEGVQHPDAAFRLPAPALLAPGQTLTPGFPIGALLSLVPAPDGY